MKATAAIEQFRKELRDFGAEQFGTDNMRTVKACVEAAAALSCLRLEIEGEALIDAEWPAARTGE